MSWYEHRAFPAINDLVTRSFARHRRRVLESATGTALEIGFGSGLSLEAYPAAVTRVIGVEPNPGMIARARALVQKPGERLPTLELVEGLAEKLPVEDASADCAVSFLTLCSVDDPARAIAELRRVLRPEGRLHFLEHMMQPGPGPTRLLQQALAPAWSRIACGCRLDRDTLKLLGDGGFEILESKTIGWDRFPNLLSPIRRGIARLKVVGT